MTFLMSFLLLLNLGYSNEPEVKKIDFSFKKASVKAVVEKYAKESGEKFIFNETNIKNHLTIVAPGKVTIPEAYNLMIQALSSEGYGILEQDKINIVLPGRVLQRSALQVVKALPESSRETYLTYIYTPKHESVDELLKISTHLISSNSSVNITENNKLIITDWLSNLKKIDKILAEVDQKKKTR